MNYRFNLLMSITLLTAATAAQAAEASKALVEIPRFKTEADIPQAKYALAGLVAGSTQQVALFGLIGQHTKTPQELVIGLFGQWILSVSGSICAQSAFAEDVRHLTAHDTECARMIFNTLDPGDTQNREQRLHNFTQRYRTAGVHTADVYNAYNGLLTASVRWRAFCEGYLLASALGPIPSFAAVVTLSKLGIISC